MAISFDTSAKTTITGSSSFSYTCTGTNRYLFVYTTYNGVTAVSYGGVSLAVIANFNGSAQPPGIKIWGLANPSSGSNTLSVTTSNGNDDILVSSYAGVDSTQPEAYNTNSQVIPNGNTEMTSSITTVTNNAWIVACARGNNTSRTLSATSGITGRQNAQDVGWGATLSMDSNGVKSPSTYNYVTAWNIGAGYQSSVSMSIKPYLAVTLTGPASGNVNSASTDFTVTPDVAINGSVTITPSGGGLSTPTVLSFSNSSTPQTFTITPTDSGVVTLTITNAVGLNNSAPLSYTANAVVPVAPTIGTAVPGNTTASVAFTSNSDGGADITEFRAISTPGSFTATGASSPLTVTGLTNGVSYTFTARATNSVGNSVESSASNAVTPYVPASSFTFTGPSSGDVRSASTNFTVTPNSTYLGTITITPTGVGSTGLSPVTLTWSLSSAAQTFTITPIASGAITLTATNSNGISNASPLTYTANAVVPLPPSIGLATPSLGSASVSFSAPSNDGGASVTMYTITSTPGSLTATTNQPGTVQVLGLTNGTSYTFTATATNSVGESASSSASNAVIPTASSTSFTNSGPKFNIERNVGNILSF